MSFGYFNIFLRTCLVLNFDSAFKKKTNYIVVLLAIYDGTIITGFAIILCFFIQNIQVLVKYDVIHTIIITGQKTFKVNV